MKHIPVMLEEVLSLAKDSVRPDSVIVDGTVGGAGHSVHLARLLGPKGILVVVDRDPEAIERSEKRIREEAPGEYELIAVQDDFAAIPDILKAEGIDAPSFILADFGVSSFQLETPERGFSFMLEGPLDMRMDNTAGPRLFTLLRNTDEEELAAVIREYGEERHARRIARAIIAGMKAREIETTLDLAEIIEETIAPLQRGPMRIHPATRTFQALRIWVNQELEAISEFVESTPDLLEPGGTLAVITFHSLEDRIVKLAFKKRARPELFLPRDVIITKDEMPEGQFDTGKPIRPGVEEIMQNPRSRSAKLRWLRKKRETGDE